MASGTYKGLAQLAAGAGIGWSSATICVALVSTGYTFDPDHATVADVSASEIAVSGYSRATIASPTATHDDSNNRTVLDAADIVFSALGAGATIGGAVVFKRVGGSDASTDPLIAFVDLNDVATNGGDVTVQWSANGIARITVA
jgi:hypothetical protein